MDFKTVEQAYTFEITDDMIQTQPPTPPRPPRNKTRRSRQVRSGRARSLVRTLARLNVGALGAEGKEDELAAAQVNLREQARATGALAEVKRLQAQRAKK